MLMWLHVIVAQKCGGTGCPISAHMAPKRDFWLFNSIFIFIILLLIFSEISTFKGRIIFLIKPMWD